VLHFRVNASWNEAGAFLRHNIAHGYSQMHFIIVVFHFVSSLSPLRSCERHGTMVPARNLGRVVDFVSRRYREILM
jgi:hypothetical protein